MYARKVDHNMSCLLLTEASGERRNIECSTLNAGWPARMTRNDVPICIEEIRPHPNKFLMAKCLMPDHGKRSSDRLSLAQKYRPTAYVEHAG